MCGDSAPRALQKSMKNTFIAGNAFMLQWIDFREEILEDNKDAEAPRQRQEDGGGETCSRDEKKGVSMPS